MLWKTLKCLTSSLASTPRRELQGAFARLSRSAILGSRPVLPCDQSITPARDTEPGIDQDKPRRNSKAITKAVHHRGVALAGVDKRLKNVIAQAVETVLVGSSAARAVVLGQLPDPSTTIDEVNHFVGTLLEHGAVLVAAGKKAAMRKATDDGPFLPTHGLQARAGKTVLKRIRFTCGRG